MSDCWWINLSLDQLEKMINNNPQKLHLWLHYVETKRRATPQLDEYVHDIAEYIDVNFKTYVVIEKE
jgi:hypothetical protein